MARVGVSGALYNKIAGASYNQIGRMITTGEVSEAQLRKVFTERRRTAMDRVRNITSESARAEFGTREREKFLPSKDLPTVSALAHELADVNRFLANKESTITGLKINRQSRIEKLQKQGFDINEKNYADFFDFMNWFKQSEYAMKYDSSSDEVQEVFSAADNATPADWMRLFNEYKDSRNNRRKKY